MATTGAPWNLWIPDTTSPVAPLQTLFSTAQTSVAVALSAFDTALHRQHVVTDLAALDALATAKIGDTAFMTTPGTGIDALTWEAFSGSGATIDWRVRDMIVAATKANLDSFISAVAAISDTRFQIGKLAYVTADIRVFIFTSTAGAYRFVPGDIIGEVQQAKGSGQTLSAGWQDVTGLTQTFVSRGEKVRAFADLFIINGNSGGNRHVDLRYMLDGVVFDDTLTTGNLMLSGGAGSSFRVWGSTTPAAGSRVIKVQAQPQAASAVIIQQSYLRIEAARA